MSSLIEVGFVIDSLVTLLKYSNLRRAEKSRPWTLSMVKTVCAMLRAPFFYQTPRMTSALLLTDSNCAATWKKSSMPHIF